MAEDFRTSLSIINGTRKPHSSRLALPPDSRSVVSAGPDGLRWNFAHKAAVTLVLGDIEEMEGVADEGMRRLTDLPHPGLHTLMLQQMREEGRKCLTIQFVREKARLRDILGL